MISQDTLSLEILISTMKRSNLDFLKPMFPKDFGNYNILIINQTEKGQELTSKYDNIRVVNSYEKGLSKSRNLALKNTKADICLIADDDIKYVENFDNIIKNAFNTNKNFDVLTFMMSDFEGKLAKKYNLQKQHNYKSLVKANSVTIAFKNHKVIETKIKFDTNFGLGSIFEIAEEFIWLRSLYKANLKIGFIPKVIVQHPYESSGRFGGSDRVIAARAALFYKYSKRFAYLKLIRYLILMLKKQQIKPNEFVKKHRIGYNAINYYKIILQSKKE
ncbi:glycosyltransferase family 2 protein [Mesoflavibacter sp. CH_XMU1422-2]|uniref:glycosyltransferase family 2 protein n=1 Tax=Mesoflavibacter sp. CH_XMU1422-2 TaxID=3107770 RepID=UPI0030087A23